MTMLKCIIGVLAMSCILLGFFIVSGSFFENTSAKEEQLGCALVLSGVALILGTII